MEFLRSGTRERGVYYLSEYSDVFESVYLSVREKEGRVLDDQLVQQLPLTLASSNLHKEWNTRIHNFRRFISYVDSQTFQTCLDIGCGNGWFTASVRKHVPNVLGLDMNRPELEQASRLFIDNNLAFAFGDIFEAPLPLAHFDVITLNASAQYFPDFKLLTIRLFELLSPEGEIHILDSPWYDKAEAIKAKKRSDSYYQSVGVDAMANHYYHRYWQELDDLNWDKLYEPQGFISKIKRKWGRESRFPWIRIKSNS